MAKQFTGLAIAMLVQEGKLSLDDDVRKYLPEVPDFGKAITIGHLLHHTSGVRDWCEIFLLSGKDPGDLLTLDMILGMVKRQQNLDFLPGEQHQYSNTGYNLLAAIIAKVTGQSFRAWMETRLFHPLGMDHTQVGDNPAEILPNRAASYAPAGGKGAWLHITSRLSATGSSSLFTTTEDMAKWLLNFETGRVGGKGALEAMLQGDRLNGGAPVDYGYGLSLGKYHGMKLVQHGGAWAGYRTQVLRVPEKRFAVAILSNAANLNAYHLAEQVADIYLNCPAEPAPSQPGGQPSAGKPNLAQWDAYLGTYRLGPAWLLTISREGDQLMAQASREARFTMTPVSERSFFVKAYGAAVEFVRDGSGPATHLNYRGIHAPRLKLPQATPAYLNTYAGDYWSEELRASYRAELRDGKLQTWHPLAGWVTLVPTGADEFDTESGFAIKFTRDSAAKLNGMLISGSRVRNLHFLRVTLSGTEGR